MAEEFPHQRRGRELPHRVPNQFIPGTNPYDKYDQDPIPQPQFTPYGDVNTPAGSPGFENAPEHYKTATGIQVFDVWDAYDMDRYGANAFKYLARWRKKGNGKTDLEKCAHSLLEALNRAPRTVEIHLNLDDIELKPDAVATAFEMEDILYDATLALLLSFTVPHPRIYLRSALSDVQDFLKLM